MEIYLSYLDRRSIDVAAYRWKKNENPTQTIRLIFAPRVSCLVEKRRNNVDAADFLVRGLNPASVVSRLPALLLPNPLLALAPHLLLAPPPSLPAHLLLRPTPAMPCPLPFLLRTPSAWYCLVGAGLPPSISLLSEGSRTKKIKFVLNFALLGLLRQEEGCVSFSKFVTLTYILLKLDV